MADMDLLALENSEVFRNYAAFIKEQDRKRDLEKAASVPSNETEEEDSLEFERFNNYVQANYQLRKRFLDLQEKFVNDYDFREKADPLFVRGVMMLDISES